MAGVLSKGIKFSMATYTGSTVGAYSEVAGLQSIPSLGGTSDKVEVTTLADAEKHYILGIKDYGDMAFKFLYDNSAATSNYRVIKGVEGSKVSVKIEFPDALTGSGTHHGTTFVFDAMLEASIDEADVNAAITFTCNAALQGAITVTNAD